MLTVINSEGRAVTAIAPAGLKVGKFAKLVGGAAAGDEPVLAAITEADVTDPTVLVGIVGYTSMDEEAADFVINTNGSLSVNTGSKNTVDIPQGAPAVLYFGKPTVRIHNALLDASLDINALVGGEAVAINSATGKLGAFDEAVAERDEPVGKVLRIDGPEVLVQLYAI